MENEKKEDGYSDGRKPPFLVWNLKGSTADKLFSFAREHTKGEIASAIELLLEKEDKIQELAVIVASQEDRINKLESAFKQAADEGKKEEGVSTLGGRLK